VNFATLIDASHRIEIGDDVSIGPYCVLVDAEAAGIEGTAAPAPITIGDRAWLASRVTLLPGATVGAGSVITAGSIVEGSIPPGVVAGGVPARVLRRLDGVDVAVETARPSDLDEPAIVPVTEPVASALLVSDFTIDPLAAALRAADPPLDAAVAPFGAVVPTLLAPPDDVDVAVVWTRPELVLPSVAAATEARSIDPDALDGEVEQYANLIREGLGSVRCVVVPTWTIASWQRGRGLTDARPGGLVWAVARANERLMAALANSENVFVVDAQRWLAAAGARAYTARGHYLGKIPFDDAVFREAAADVAAAWLAVSGAARKLVVVDLDNTLWGGVVGDDGWEALRLGGHDGDGEAFVDFQRGLLALRRRGVLLGIASKNEEHIALEAIDRHDAMVLRREDFVGWRIDWGDKGANIAALAADLNLGLQSVVFIDDNRHERARVRDALPEVLVPDWPDDPTMFPAALAALRCFDAPSLTAEDLDRTQLYAAEQERSVLRSQVESIEDWLRDLGTVVRVEPLGASNLTRATQLLNKTNQMNLRTRRLSSGELEAWAEPRGRATWCVSVADRLGDAGLTGIVSVELDGNRASIVDFVLSCRVMGRRIEETMLHLAGRMARALDATVLVAEPLPTAKNAPCLRFFAGSGLSETEDRYVVEVADAPPLPDVITLELAEVLQDEHAGARRP
jgi:FkbH-like protein